MKTFEPILVDEEMNEELLKSFIKVTFNNYKITKVNNYTYACTSKKRPLRKVTRFYLYFLLNEFTRQMYIGTTKNIKKQLSSDKSNEVLGANDNVILNALFIFDIEEIFWNQRVYSPSGQMVSIKQRLKDHLNNLGYNVQGKSTNNIVEQENNFIENYLVKRYEEELIQQKTIEETEFINWALNRIIAMAESGRYEYFSVFYGREVEHECTYEELVALNKDALLCKEILKKEMSNYMKSDWEFIRKCLYHRSNVVSLWESGYISPDNMFLLQKYLNL